MSEEAQEMNEQLDALVKELHRGLVEADAFRGSLIDEHGAVLCAGEVFLYEDAPGGLFEPTSAFLSKETAARATTIKSHDRTNEPVPIFGVMKCPCSGVLHFHFLTGEPPASGLA